MARRYMLNVRIPDGMREVSARIAEQRSCPVGEVVRTLIETNLVYQVDGVGEDLRRALPAALGRQCEALQIVDVDYHVERGSKRP